VASQLPEVHVMKNVRRLVWVGVSFLALTVFCIVTTQTAGQDGFEPGEHLAVEQWEYLAVAGPSTTNLSATGNPRMRKEPNSPFGREAFVLEQHLDSLGAQGWELVAVAGPPIDPAYYFKRRKRAGQH
jgi:hypothetical protein